MRLKPRLSRKQLLTLLSGLAVIFLTYFAAAFAIGKDRSCGLGGTVYSYLGLFSFPVLVVLALSQLRDAGIYWQVAVMLLVLVLAAVAWIAAFLLADFRLVCKLF